MIEFLLRLLDPDWYFFRKKVKEQKKHQPIIDERGWYYLTLMHRGENFLYTDKNGSTYVKTGIISPCFVAASSIKKWNYFLAVSDTQRDLILERVIRYFKENGEACSVV